MAIIVTELIIFSSLESFLFFKYTKQYDELLKNGNSTYSPQIAGINTTSITLDSPTISPSPKIIKNSPTPVVQTKTTGENKNQTSATNNQQSPSIQPSPSQSPAASPSPTPNNTPLQAELTIERRFENGTHYLRGTVTANKSLSTCQWTIGMISTSDLAANGNTCTSESGQSPSSPKSAKVTIHTPEGEEMTLEKS